MILEVCHESVGLEKRICFIRLKTKEDKYAAPLHGKSSSDGSDSGDDEGEEEKEERDDDDDKEEMEYLAPDYPQEDSGMTWMLMRQGLVELSLLNLLLFPFFFFNYVYACFV